MTNKSSNKATTKILAIESSCDETSAAVVELKMVKKGFPLSADQRIAETIIEDITIHSNIVSSQVKLHAKYGGVYPELASREHVKNIIPVIQATLEEERIMNKELCIDKSKFIIHNSLFNDIDAIAVTTGPGLIGSLLVGVETAKALAYVLNKPIYPINHVEGHIYANFIRLISNSQFLISNQIPNSNVLKLNHLKFNKNLKLKTKNSMPEFPLVVLVVSGGHTSLIYMKNHLNYEVIGETLDDAAGEAFDKVAKMLDLGYPGGPVIAKMAMTNPKLETLNSKQILNPKFQTPNSLPKPTTNFHFPRPMLDSGDFDFSFSGLKTSVLYTIKKLPKPLSPKIKVLVCKEFQDAVVETLVAKTIKAAEKYKVKSVLLGGGVAANKELRENLKLKVKNEKLKINVFIPPIDLCTDNAAMIGAAAAYKIALCKKPTPWYNVDANSNLKL